MSFNYMTPAISKWKLDDFMRIVDDFENTFADTVDQKFNIQQDYKTILLHIAGKSLVTTREILTLCAHGYSDGALALGRNLYEQMMILIFFDIHKNDTEFQEYVDDFFLSYEVQRNKCFRDIHQYIPENISALNDEWELLKKRTHREIKGDYWWTGYSTFSRFVNHIMQHQKNDDAFFRFLGIHYMRYKRACISLHAGCMGNSIRIGKQLEDHVVDTSPSLCGQSSPLIYAAVSLIAIVGCICTAFSIDREEHLEPLNRLVMFYQEQEKEDCEE